MKNSAKRGLLGYSVYYNDQPENSANLIATGYLLGKLGAYYNFDTEHGWTMNGTSVNGDREGFDFAGAVLVPSG